MLIEWIKSFKQKNDRSPKILHIGNIANNAYQNAKMLNKAGADCDVLVSDYYHVAGCPEWDDADFIGEIKDQFYPAWHNVDLNGFERPKWFAQGYGSFCLKYLLAKRTNKTITANFWWKALEFQRKKVVIDFKVYTNIAQIFKNFFWFLRFILKVAVMFFTDFKLFKEKITLRILGKIKKHSLEDNEDIIRLNQQFTDLFPDRIATFSEMSLSYQGSANTYKKLFDQYDIIIGYADTPILPYLAGCKNYIAFEHGSIRDLPYEDNDRGRLMLLAYANARAVYVTNIDCVDSAKYITKNSKAEIVYGLHGIDINRIKQKINNAKLENDSNFRFGVDAEEKVFFCPARHDIDPTRGVFLKGNEKIVEAAGKLSEQFNNFKLVFVHFGNDTDKIKQLIKKHEKLEEQVVWIEPLGKSKLYQAYLMSDAVLDQFLLKAFGAITIEALCACGGALISEKVPDEEMVKFFGEQLPSFKCENTEDIFNAMYAVMVDEKQTKQRAEKGLEWINKYHSNERIVSLLCEAFSHCDL